MKESQKDNGLEEALSIVHSHEAHLLCGAFMHSAFSSALLQSRIFVTSDRILIDCCNRTVADIWCDKCVELCQIVLDTLKLPLRVVVSWLGSGELKYDIPTHKILNMTADTSSPNRSLRVLEQVVSSQDNREDRQLLDEVMREDEARCLVELDSDRPIICSNTLATLVQQTASEWRRTDLRRHWAENPKEFQDKQDDAPGYLKEVKTALHSSGSLLLSYDTWLTDDVYGSFRSSFERVVFQGTVSRLVTIYDFASRPIPAFA